MKDLAAIFKIKNTFLTDNELIKICYNSRVDRHLKVKCIEDFVWKRCNIYDFYN